MAERLDVLCVKSAITRADVLYSRVSLCIRRGRRKKKSAAAEIEKDRPREGRERERKRKKYVNEAHSERFIMYVYRTGEQLSDSCRALFTCSIHRARRGNARMCVCALASSGSGTECILLREKGSARPRRPEAIEREGEKERRKKVSRLWRGTEECAARSAKERLVHSLSCLVYRPAK